MQTAGGLQASSQKTILEGTWDIIMVTTAKISLFLDIIKHNKCFLEGSLRGAEHQEQYINLAPQFKNKEWYFILSSIFSIK